MSATVPTDYPMQMFATKAAWRTWLKKNHAAERGIWLRIAKKSSGLRSIAFEDALDVALCYGWIDGMRKGFDDDTFIQKFTPRGKRSLWSKKNIGNVERLIASGEMQPAGMAEIERARADGRWDRAYDGPASAAVPPDLEKALKASPEAAAFFKTLKSQNRFAILHRIQTAIKPETRAKRIAQFVAMLDRQETIYPQ